MSRPIKILIVDTNPNNIIALETTLKAINIIPIWARNSEEAEKHLHNHEFALAIIDAHMPKMAGFELAKTIHQQQKSTELPIIFRSTIFTDDVHINKGYDCGAVDFITPPFNPKIITSKIAIFIQFFKQKQKLEATIYQLQKQKKTISNQNILLREKTIRDDLSGLYNRRHLRYILAREFNKCKKSNTEMSLLYFDLDYFKNINDTLGHDFGDVVIQQFGACLEDNCRESDLLFRIGGEEFLAILPDTDIHTAATVVAEKIRHICENDPFKKGNTQRKVTVSIGVSSYQQNHPTIMNDLISFADRALYAAKEKGRNQVVIYNAKHNLPSGNC